MEQRKLSIDVMEGSRPGERIVLLDGLLNAETAFVFGDRAREKNPQSLVIDMTNVASLDSSGLGVLIGLYVSFEKSGRPLILVGANERVRDLFRMCKVEEVFTQYPTLAEAQEALTQAGR
jgi:anti-anti-sigma factor